MSLTSDSVVITAMRSPFFSSGSEVTAKTCSAEPARSCSFSSIRMCGTISPPILLNRESRSVMVEVRRHRQLQCRLWCTIRLHTSVFSVLSPNIARITLGPLTEHAFRGSPLHLVRRIQCRPLLR